MNLNRNLQTNTYTNNNISINDTSNVYSSHNNPNNKELMILNNYPDKNTQLINNQINNSQQMQNLGVSQVKPKQQYLREKTKSKAHLGNFS